MIEGTNDVLFKTLGMLGTFGVNIHLRPRDINWIMYLGSSMPVMLNIFVAFILLKIFGSFKGGK